MGLGNQAFWPALTGLSLLSVAEEGLAPKGCDVSLGVYARMPVEVGWDE